MKNTIHQELFILEVESFFMIITFILPLEIASREMKRKI